MIKKERFALENQQLQLEKKFSISRLRNQIAQDIHDEIGSGLTKISLNAQVTARMKNLKADDYRNKLSKIDTDAQYLSTQMREVIFAINPEFDNFEDLQAYFKDQAQEFWSSFGIEPFFDFERKAHNPIVSPQIKRQLLLIFKEGQNNAAKHAQATRIYLTFKLTSTDQYLLEIKDNGIGFVYTSINGFSKGLKGMEKRAEDINASFFLDSNLGQGTTIKIVGKLQHKA